MIKSLLLALLLIVAPAGMALADIGAGTGFFTRLFVEATGSDGWVYAVDIAPDLRVRAGVLREEREAFDRTEFSLAVARTF